MIDHGSRLSIALELIANKHSTTLFWILLRSFAKFGKPRIIRADRRARVAISPKSYAQGQKKRTSQPPSRAIRFKKGASRATKTWCPREDG
jgi:hypothetical protein